MKVQCDNISDFVENLKIHEEKTGSTVVFKLIYLAETKDPLNGNKKTATSWAVSIIYSCVIANEDGSEILMEAVEDCGVERHTADADTEVFDKKKELLELVQKFAEPRGITIANGVARIS